MSTSFVHRNSGCSVTLGLIEKTSYQIAIYQEKYHCPSGRTALRLARTFCIAGQLKRKMPRQKVASCLGIRRRAQSSFINSTGTAPCLLESWHEADAQ